MTDGVSPGSWAHGAAGRVVTCPDPSAAVPDAFVLTDGVLVRAAPDGPAACLPGAAVTLRFDAAAGRLYAAPVLDEETGARSG